jgi:hypothetical protein
MSFRKLPEMNKVPLTTISKTQGLPPVQPPPTEFSRKLPSEITDTPAGMMIFPLPSAFTIMLPEIVTLVSKVRTSPFPKLVLLPNVTLLGNAPHAAENITFAVPGKSTSQFCAWAPNLMNTKSTAVRNRIAVFLRDITLWFFAMN